MRYCVVLFALLSIVFGTASHATDTVYIDGVPCNVPCQAYMAWSRRVLQEMTRQPEIAPRRDSGIDLVMPGAPVRDRVVRRASPDNVKAHRQAKANARPQTDRVTSAKAPASQQMEAPKSVQPPPPNKEQQEAVDNKKSPAPQAKEPQATGSVARESSSVAITPSGRNAHAEIPSAPITDDKLTERKPLDKMPSQPTGDATSAAAPTTVQHQALAAAAVAEQLTVVGTQELRSMHGEQSDIGTEMRPDDHSSAAPVENTLVALVVTRPEIKSVQELAGKEVAIDKRYSNAEGNVRTAMAAAGASEVRLNDTEALAIERLAGGQVPAAVLTLVSPDAAKAFPQLVGFSVFQVPLSPNGGTANP